MALLKPYKPKSSNSSSGGSSGKPFLLSRDDAAKYGTNTVDAQTYAQIKRGVDPSEISSSAQTQSNQITNQQEPVMAQNTVNAEQQAKIDNLLGALNTAVENKKREPLMISSVAANARRSDLNKEIQTAVNDVPRANIAGNAQTPQTQAVVPTSPQNATVSSPSPLPADSGIQAQGLQQMATASSFLTQSLNDIDLEMADITRTLDSYMRRSDGLTNEHLSLLKDNYAIRKEEVREINDRAVKALEMEGNRSGSSRYASNLQTQLLSEEERRLHQELRRVDNDERQALLEVRTAQNNNQLNIASTRMQAVRQARTDRQNLVMQLFQNAQSVNAEVRAQRNQILGEEQTVLNIQTTKASVLARGLAMQLSGLSPEDKEVMIAAAARENGINETYMQSAVEEALMIQRAEELGIQLDQANLLSAQALQTQRLASAGAANALAQQRLRGGSGSGGGTLEDATYADIPTWEDFLTEVEDQYQMNIDPNSNLYSNLRAEYEAAVSQIPLDIPDFTPTEKKKLAQAGLLNASQQEQLDYLFGRSTSASSSAATSTFTPEEMEEFRDWVYN